VGDDAFLEVLNVLACRLVEDLVLGAFAVADEHVRNVLSEEVAADAVLLEELGALVDLVLHELFLTEPQRLSLVAVAREVGLCVLDGLLEVLEALLVGVDEEFVIEEEGEGTTSEDAQVEGKVAMVAAHAIEEIDQLHSQLADAHRPQHLLQLHLHRVPH
jgi:hypothetical protein